MRTLELNKSKLWCVNSLGMVDIKDEDGYFTGEKEIQYSVPIEIELPLYPANGEIKDRIFGKDISFDMISVSNDIELSENSLLFRVEPTGNYDTTYDFKISSIAKSLNNWNYGLKGRV